MKSEEALALLLGRLFFDDLTKVRIYHLIKNGLDWYEFLNICIRKKLICMVYKSLSDLGLIQLLPMIVINNMQYHYDRNQKQNEIFLEASEALIACFKQKNILAVPIKGLRFLTTIYSKSPAVRILNDIDFIASASNQYQINDLMLNSGYKPYLINDRDALCYSDSNRISSFYIKFEPSDPYGKLRIDFDYGCSDKWISDIVEEKSPIYEFLYLCCLYYEKMHNTSQIDDISSYNYIKLIDLHEYYYAYLLSFSSENILAYADAMNIHQQTVFTLNCLKRIYPDMR